MNVLLEVKSPFCVAEELSCEGFPKLFIQDLADVILNVKNNFLVAFVRLCRFTFC